jgi:2-oxoglutarate ferredoxin oxidoreductase subunit delta
MILKRKINGSCGFTSNKHGVRAGEIDINQSKCDGCGVCANTCPNNVLVIKNISDKEFEKLSLIGKLKVKIKGRQKSYVKNLSSCTACKRCEKVCHESAIKVGDRIKKQNESVVN